MQSIFLLLGLFADAISASPLGQQPLGRVSPTELPDQLAEGLRKPVRGRFLHITDFHPDRLYEPGTSIDRSCHRGDGPAGYFGAEGTECDSPLSLVNETFRWIEENLKDEIDFVIWTGDSVRHDNDEKLPRTADEIMELNAFLSQKWISIFGEERETSNSVPKMSIPVIPTFGNNDIMPHNIFNKGPNKWTKRFAEIWNQFIPEDQRHTFVEGGWFTSEVVPGRLAVISLNTMYFFDSNSAVDGCNAKSEPGYEHMEWLRVQLKILRSRNMKVILMGHVPPARSSEKKNWDETCWQKYTLWMHQYRDIVVGSFYGHMNIDHFLLQDSNKVKIDSKADGKVSISSKTDYLESLRSQWSSLPSPPSGVFEDLDSASNLEDTSEVEPAKNGKGKKKGKKKQKFLDKIGGPWAERYSVSLVSPSLVPNFFPSLRVIDYNITGLDDVAHGVDLFTTEVDDTTFRLDHAPIDTPKPSDNSLIPPETKKKKKGKDKKKKPKFKVPEPPSSTAPPGPAYSNQPFTLLGYTQYYSNLTKLHEQMAASKGGDPPRVDYEIEYTTNDDVYQMKDLTVRSFFQLANIMAEEGTEEQHTRGVNSQGADPSGKKKKPTNDVWRTFLRRAFVGFEVDDLDE
ncbi:unnamed protein product [Penicillium glandicola]